MSRPDSMMLVQTSTSASPRRNCTIRSSSARSSSWPWATTKRSLGHRPRRRSAVSSIVSTRLCRKNACPPRAASRSSAWRTSSSSYSPTQVRTGRRPSGAVSMTEMSRSPASDICSVRGIGVADIDRTSTRSRSCRSRSFWRTPKRCSSSTISSPRSLARTSRESRRWVPIRMSTFPSLNAAMAARCSRGGRKRETCSTRIGQSRSRSAKVP